MDELLWTGERLVTSIFNENSLEHLHRYSLVMEYGQEKRILDIACGEGYGSMLLSTVASEVVGADISLDAIQHARRKYIKDNLKFIVSSADAIQCENESFDIVVSFETIEHLNKHEEMLLEIKRVLKKGGILIISSPDKYNYSEKNNQNNPFHVHELYEFEFKELIKKYFSNSAFLEQRSDYVSLIKMNNQIDELCYKSGNYEKIDLQAVFEPIYWIAIASDKTLPQIKVPSVFKNDALNKRIYQTAIERDYFEKLSNLYLNSLPYKIGRIFLYPLRLFKRIIGL
jgi:ubiquinone/menaquinone biosynthesis C-methylase UbiE